MFSINTICLFLCLSASVLANCSTRPTLRQGSKGVAVSSLQILLNEKGGYGLAVDGDFGPATSSAVRSWQSSRGLAVDGIVGPNTWASLCGSTSTTPPSSGCSNFNNPHPIVPKGTSPVFNPIMRFVVDKIMACFSRSEIEKCTTYIGGSGSDHPGNAADCWQYSKASGDRLAQWAVDNRVALKVNYVIFHYRIWSRAHPYWRPYNGPSPHTDHIHISALSP